MLTYRMSSDRPAASPFHLWLDMSVIRSIRCGMKWGPWGLIIIIIVIMTIIMIVPTVIRDRS